MKKTKLVLSTLMLITLVSCGSNTSSSSKISSAVASQSSKSSASINQEVEIEDMIGRKVTVKPGTYKKVVCIGAGALRMYSYIADASLLCGVEDIENDTLTTRPKMFDGVARPYFIANKEVYRTLPSCGVGGPQAQTAEAEKILSCNPDIIISEYEDVTKENALQEQVGVPVITLKTGSKGVFANEFASSMTLLGKIFNQEAKANTLNTFVSEQKALITNRTKDVAEANKKNVYICGLGNWGTTNHLMTAQNYEPFNISNIKNAITGLSNNGIQAIEKEKFEAIGSSIDVMIIDAAAVKNIKPSYKADNTIFASTKAWNDGEVYLQMAYNAYYTNYEIALINTWFNAKVVYPSLFEDIDMVAKTNEVTRAFLGKDLATEIFAYANSFGGYQKINPSTFFGA